MKIPNNPYRDMPSSPRQGVQSSPHKNIKTCPHSSFYKERIKGQQTGDYVCFNCGFIGSRTEMNQEVKHSGVSRIDQAPKFTHGWSVRVRIEGKIKSKFFSDKKLGGRDMALVKALEWRDGARE